MFDDLNEARERADRQERLTRRLAALEKEQKQAQQSAAALRKLVAQEQADVDQWESRSLSTLLTSLFVDTEARLRKERQEAVAAELKFDQALLRLSELGDEAERVRTELKELAGAREAHQRMTEQRRAEVERKAGPELIRFGEREQAARGRLKEIEEALKAGMAADSALRGVEERLGSASTWGVFDMLGGNLITGMIKHSQIDEAQREAQRAQRALASFRRELQDVQIDLRPEAIAVEGFLKFADFFFDNLLTDFMVQSRINSARDGVRRARSQVRELVDSLSRRQGQARAELDAVERERERYIADFPS